MKLRTKLQILASLIIIISFSPGLYAQSIDSENKIEFLETNEANDLNAIKVNRSGKKLRAKANNKTTRTITNNIESFSQLEKLVEKKRLLRYRNKRVHEDKKCYSAAEESCSEDEEKKE